MGYLVHAPRVAELSGAYKPPPVPPGYAATQAPAGVPLVHAVEPTEGDWSQGGKYGRLINEQVPARIADELGVFSNDNIGKPRKRVVSLVRTDRQIITDGNWDFYARITHGVGGSQNSFFCDWSGDVPVVADSIRVEAVFYAVDADLPYSPPDPNRIISIGAFLGEVGGSPHFPPTFTTPFATVPDNEIFVANLPDFARNVVVNVDRSPIVAEDYVLQFVGSAGVIKQVDVTQDVMLSGCVIPGNTNAVIVTNQSGLSTVVSLTFQLGL